MPENLRDKLINLLESLTDRKVFCIYCGKSTGSVLDIHFTPTKLRRKAIDNPFISQRHREYMGTISLFVECTWRLQFNGKILAAASDKTADAEDVFHTVEQLENVAVTKVVLPGLDHVLDFTLCFQNGLMFTVFCDTGVSSRDSYTIFDGDSYLTVVSGSELNSNSLPINP